ncbi:MAG: M23 family metallopeptidase [Desulfovibrio sp.]|uniref:M23 family metallopeptidase n=1 Tax=Desulfovibrio sp. TaxID=885 RepID=UPI0025BBEA53|nr:M23 family metallopeptidase [Desulfovibrio sp.]MCI7569026.1 M23 family metallopeptidase [Desulfovibrio sp.]
MKNPVRALLPALLFLCVFGASAPAGATPLLEAPDRVARGDAFLVLASSDRPTQRFTFSWGGKDYAADAYQDGGRWQAVMLLGMPLEEKQGRRTLIVRDGGESCAAEIAVFDRKRPVQKLSVDKKYVSPPPEVMARIREDRRKTARALAVYSSHRRWTAPFVRPVEGGVSSLYGLRRVFNGQPRGFHKGLDLRSPAGTPIRACADGVVTLADNLYFSGNAVYLDHGLGVATAYLHMSKILVRPGDSVQRGQVIGLVGATGRVTGPHLHLTLFAQGQSVDILPLLEKVEKR